MRTPSPGAAVVTTVGAHLGDPAPSLCPINALPGVGRHVGSQLSALGSRVPPRVQRSLSGVLSVSFSWNVSRGASAASLGQAQVIERPRGPCVLFPQGCVVAVCPAHGQAGLKVLWSYSSVRRKVVSVISGGETGGSVHALCPLTSRLVVLVLEDTCPDLSPRALAPSPVC